MILWDKFNCNFKYIFINEIGFIKKIVLVVGQINKKIEFYGMGWGFAGPQGLEMGQENFLRHVRRGGGEDPILQTRTAPLPSLQSSTGFRCLSIIIIIIIIIKTALIRRKSHYNLG